MTARPEKLMREVLISAIGDLMEEDDSIFFLSADMGAPSLDRIREDYTDRFINVGISEQNMINVAAGLAMEGYTVYTYAIASFYLRALDQIRINLALPSQLRDMNVNMLALGAGISYDVSGPTHHALEDISMMRTMPNILTISPGDWVTAQSLVEFVPEQPCPKYFRLDGKAQPALYDGDNMPDFTKGFTHLKTGNRLCFVSTGVMVHQALAIAESFADDVGVVDLFMLDRADDDTLADTLASYSTVITLEEGFLGRGGLDAYISLLISAKELDCRHQGYGLPNAFDFTPGSRFKLHEANGFGGTQITEAVRAMLS